MKQKFQVKIQVRAARASLTARLTALALRATLGNRAVVHLVEGESAATPPSTLALALNGASLDFLHSLGIQFEGESIKKIKIYAASDLSRSRPPPPQPQRHQRIFAPPLTLRAEEIERESLGLMVWQAEALKALDDKVAEIPTTPLTDEDAWTIETDAPVVSTPYQQVALTGVLALKNPPPPRATAEQFFYPSGPLALLPLAAQRCFFVWTRPKKQAATLLKLAPATFTRHLKEHMPPEWQGARLVGKIAGQALRFYFSAYHHEAAPRTMWLGASVHQPHPLAGQGFNICLEDIALLCRLLARDQACGLLPFNTSQLAEYNAARRAHAGALVRAIDVLARFPLLSNRLSAAALDFINLTPRLRSALTAAGAGSGASLLHTFFASLNNKSGTPSRTG